MNNTILLQIVLLFSLIALGYLVNKAAILNDTANKYLSAFLLKVALPATIIQSAVGQTEVHSASIVKVIFIAVGVFIFIPALSMLVAKLFHMDNTYQLMLNYSNLGFMGFPIIGSLYGAEAVFYAAIFMMMFNFHIFSFGIMTLRGKPESLNDMLKSLCNPGIFSAFIALSIFLFHIPVATPITNLLSSVGNMTTPLAMIVIGSQLAEVNLVESLKTRALYIMTLFKIVIYPMITFAILYLLIGNTELTGITTILVGLPTAGNVTMLCSVYGGDTSLAAKGTCITTLFSLLTIPVMMAIF